MVSDVMFSSKTCEWETPQHVFDALNDEFNFTLDVCANEQNHKCDRYFTEEDDGLTQKWIGTCWMNPPYGKKIGEWVRKAEMESRMGNTVVCLLPVRSDTKWWHNHVMFSSEIRLIEGRLKFGGAKNSAPFPSAIVIFNGESILPTITSVKFNG